MAQGSAKVRGSVELDIKSRLRRLAHGAREGDFPVPRSKIITISTPFCCICSQVLSAVRKSGKSKASSSQETHWPSGAKYNPVSICRINRCGGNNLAFMASAITIHVL